MAYLPPKYPVSYLTQYISITLLPLIPSTMVSSVARHRDSAIFIYIHLFGLSYFVFFLAIVLFQQFPRSLEAIPVAQGLMCYGSGVMVWCMCSLTYHAVLILSEDNAAYWQKLDFAATLLLVYTAAVPFIILYFSGRPYLQVGYVASLAVVTIGNMVHVLAEDPRNFGMHSKSILPLSPAGPAPKHGSQALL